MPRSTRWGARSEAGGPHQGRRRLRWATPWKASGGGGVTTNRTARIHTVAADPYCGGLGCPGSRSTSTRWSENQWDCKDQQGEVDNDDDDGRFQGIAIKGKRMEDDSIFLRLRITDKNNPGLVRNIYFPFDPEHDTALSVATEMVGELDITDHEVTHIAEMIDGEVGALLPHWRPGCSGVSDNDEAGGGGADDPNHDARCQNCQSSASSSGGSSLDDYMSAARRGCRCVEMHDRFEEITFQADEEAVLFQSSGCSSDE